MPPHHPFRWSYILVTALAAITFSIVVGINPWFDLIEIFYYFFIAPIVALVWVGLAIWKRNLSIAAALVVYLCLSVLTFHFSLDIRIHSRWLFGAPSFKREVFNQPNPQTGQLRHMEWDGWGFAFAETNLYLVFDPDNTLDRPSQAKLSGKFAGLPCEVPRVYRLESNWYAAQFYTDDSWEECHQ